MPIYVAPPTYQTASKKNSLNNAGEYIHIDNEGSLAAPYFDVAAKGDPSAVHVIDLDWDHGTDSFRRSSEFISNTK